MAKKDKDPKTLEAALKNINKQFGEMSVSFLDDSVKLDVGWVPTGSFTLDRAIGGGIPKGRIIEAYGAESSGKSSICMHVIAELQKQGGVAAYVDAEHAYNKKFAASLGVDNSKLLFAQPNHGEEALAIVEQLIPHADLIVVDSVANLTPKVILEGDFDQSHMGVQARMMSQALKKLTATASEHNCAIIFINQLRKKIGVMYGDPTTTPGGESLKFYASLRLDVKKRAVIKEGEKVVGHEVEVIVKKNKVGAPFNTASFNFYYERGGIDKIGEIMDIAIDGGLIEKSGAWFTVNDTRLQGKTAVRDYLVANPEYFATLSEQVMILLDK